MRNAPWGNEANEIWCTPKGFDKAGHDGWDNRRYVVDADLKSYFDTIPHERHMDRIRRKIADGRVLHLLEQFLTQSVLDGLEELTPEQGTPKGAVSGPLLANIYLDPLDHLLAEQGLALVRYADDIVMLCRTAEEAQRALALVQQWTADADLTLRPHKTRIVDVRQQGLDFLGYHFQRTKSGLNHWPRPKSLAKFKETLRAKTKRNSRRSLRCIIADVNPVLRGWFAYFKHSLQTTFASVDGWVRMRLRSILRRRKGKRGRGRGSDHQRWPNAYFAEQGLYSLREAHVLAGPSPSGSDPQRESRMRESRLSGSEGGGAELNRPSLPLSFKPLATVAWRQPTFLVPGISCHILA